MARRIDRVPSLIGRSVFRRQYFGGFVRPGLTLRQLVNDDRVDPIPESGYRPDRSYPRAVPLGQQFWVEDSAVHTDSLTHNAATFPIVREEEAPRDTMGKIAESNMVFGNVQRMHRAFDIVFKPIRPRLSKLLGMLRGIGRDRQHLAR